MTDSRSGFTRVLDSVIASFAPGTAVRRALQRDYLAQFESGGPANRLTNVKRSNLAGDALLDLAGTTVRERARWLDENHDVAIGIMNVLVDNIVGTGTSIEPQVKNAQGDLVEKANEEIRRLWDDWVERPDVTWQYDFAELERAACLHWLRDGEVLTQMVSGPAKLIDHGTEVPFSLELIEADFLPQGFNDAARNIRQGIQRNAWGKPLGYWLFKSHPNDTVLNSLLSPLDFTALKYVRAEDMLFLRYSRRASQLRGVSILVSVINRLGDVKQYEDFERVAAQIAAALTVFIARDVETECPAWLTSANASSTPPLKSIAPGMMLEGAPGEEPKIIQSNRPNNQLKEFREANLRAVSGGTGAGYSSISKSYEGSYSSQRQELVEQDRRYMVMRGYLQQRFSSRVYQRFVDTALLNGNLAKFLMGVDMRSIYDCQYTGNPMPWVDPLKEMLAVEKRLELGVTSKSQVIREMGFNPREVAKQIERDNNEMPEPNVQAKPTAPGFPGQDDGGDDADKPKLKPKKETQP